MKKRILSVLIAVSMFLTAVPSFMVGSGALISGEALDPEVLREHMLDIYDAFETVPSGSSPEDFVAALEAYFDYHYEVNQFRANFYYVWPNNFDAYGEAYYLLVYDQVSSREEIVEMDAESITELASVVAHQVVKEMNEVVLHLGYQALRSTWDAWTEYGDEFEVQFYTILDSLCDYIPFMVERLSTNSVHQFYPEAKELYAERFSDMFVWYTYDSSIDFAWTFMDVLMYANIDSDIPFLCLDCEDDNHEQCYSYPCECGCKYSWGEWMWNMLAEDYAEDAKDETAKTLTIYTAEELALFAFELYAYARRTWDEFEGLGYNYRGWTVALGADIDLTGGYWTPAEMFEVEFDGKGHTISGLTVESTWYNYMWRMGLFSLIEDCTVMNFTLANPVLTSSEVFEVLAGAVAGSAYGSVILGITVDEPVITIDYVGPNAFIGGIVGDIWGYDGDKMVLLSEGDASPEYSKIVSCTVNGGRLGITDGFLYSACKVTNTITGNADIGTGSTAYIGGIAGTNYYGLIGNSAVYDTEIFAPSTVDASYEFTPPNSTVEADEGTITLFAAGGIVGYTSETDDPPWGGWGTSCLLNNFSSAVFNISEDLETSDFDGEYDGLSGSFVGGIAGYVKNDNIVSNLYIGDSVDVAFGDVSNTLTLPKLVLTQLTESESIYLEENNFAFADFDAALDADVYTILNDVTEFEGNMWLLASLDPNLDIEEAVEYYRTWTVNAATGIPAFGRYMEAVPNTVATYSLEVPVAGATAFKGNDAHEKVAVTIVWDNGNPGRFAGNTEYTATITFSSKPGYYFSKSITEATVNGDVADDFANDMQTLTFAMTFPATGDYECDCELCEEPECGLCLDDECECPLCPGPCECEPIPPPPVCEHDFTAQSKCGETVCGVDEDCGEVYDCGLATCMHFEVGDVDGDGTLGIMDALEILKFLAGISNKIETVPSAFDAAMIVTAPAENAAPGIMDALEILKSLAGIANVIDEVWE